MQTYIPINIQNGNISFYDLKELFKFLHKLNPEIPEDYANIGSVNSNNSEKDEKIKELEKNLKRYEEENKNKANLEQELQNAKRTLEVKDSMIEQLKNEKEVALNKQKEELTQKINLKDDEITKLNNQIHELESRISIYEPTLSNNISEKKYFNIEDSFLNETMSDDAPIIAKIDANGNGIFQFNIDKGPHKTMSQNKAVLDNFFEIIEEIEGANHISMGEWGKAKYRHGTLTVNTKAKIRLTRD